MARFPICQSFLAHRSLAVTAAFLLSVLALNAQSTNIAVGSNVLQPSVKRLGINLSIENFYDSGQMTKNLIFRNPGFEGEIYHSTIRCASGTSTSCVDDDPWSAWPAGFWNGATVEFFYGAAQGRTGTVANFTAASGSTGGTFTFAGSGTTPANGDYMIVRKTVPGNATAGWWPSTSGSGTITTNSSDLPPGTTGLQTAALSAPSSSDSASLAAYFDGTVGKSFVALKGTFQLSFRAKATGGSNSVAVNLQRYGLTTYLNQTVSLTNSWATYTLSFNPAETGAPTGSVGLKLTTVGADSFLLDDVSLTQTNGDPTNATTFRDAVVNALKTLNPGVMRFWAGQLGDTLDNLIAGSFGRQRAGYSAFSTEQDDISYGLPEFLQLCEALGAEPWMVIPSTLSTTDAANMIEYLSGSTATPYGAKRAAAGHPAPWTSSFAKIHLEFGNEAWNSVFKGGTIEYSAPYGQRAQAIFGAMRADGAYISSAFDLVLGGQAAWAGRNQDIQNNCNNNDSFAIAPYMMNNVDAFSNNEDLFGSTFAEPEAYMSTSGTSEGVSAGLILQNQQAIQASNHPVPIELYEMNLSTVGGSITQTALNSYASSVGGGLAVVDSMLQQMRAGILTQNLFALPQYQFLRGDGSSVFLWGSVIDMGVTDRRRPQFLAQQLANQAIGSNAVMLQTVHSGANPTWNQALVNSVQLNGAHYLQSFAFSSGSQHSVVVFNLHRTSSLPVTFSGANAPGGTVQMQQLTSAQLTDTNENAAVVNIASQALSAFNAGAGLSLPPFSMTVLTWSGATNPAPVITSVASSAITGTSATITWTTDQASSSQVAYGATAAYGSLSALSSSPVTSHSVSLSGLTAGTAYNYAVISASSTGSTTSTNYTFSTPAAPLPVITSVTAGAITTTSATITWNTDQASSSQVFYGTTTGYGSSSALNSSPVTSHSVTVSGLTPGTAYNYDVSSGVTAGATTSTNFTFSTAKTALPVITSVSSTGISGTSATITWTTDQASSSQVAYGVTAGYGSLSGLNSSLVTAHSVTLSGLNPGTAYNYAVMSASSNGTATSTNFAFSTPAGVPVITAVSASSITGNSATITWTTDQPSSSQVEFGTTAAFGSSSAYTATLTTSHSVSLTGLIPGTAYVYAAMSVDAAGLGTSSNFSFSTPGAAPVIGSVVAGSITTSSVTITWTTDQASNSQVKFGLNSAYGSLSTLGTGLVQSHSVTLTGLTAGTTYNFAALSANAAGLSSASPNMAFTTTANSSSPAPILQSVVYWGITGSSITVSWSTDQSSNTAIEYGTTSALGLASPVQTAMSTGHGVVLSGLASATTYYFRARSTNASNVSGYSAISSFTTLDVTAPVVSNVQVLSATGHAAVVTWAISKLASSQVEFGTSTNYGLWTSSTALSQNPQVTLWWVPSGTIHFRIHTTDSAGNQSVTGDFTFVEP